LRAGDAFEEEDFAAVEFAGEELDGGAGDGEGVGEEADEGFICAAFDGRSLDGDLELSGIAFAVDAGEGGLFCAGLGAESDCASGGGFADHALERHAG